MIDVRLVDHTDAEAIERTYKEFIEGNKAKPWFKYIDKSQVLAILNNSAFIIQNTYLVVISEISPWYFGSKTVLEEQLIAKIYPEGKGKFSDVLIFLEEEARARGCVAVFAGSMLAIQHKQLTRLYTSKGFTEEGGQFLLNLND